MEVSEFIELIRRATNDFKIHLDALIDAEVNEPDLLKI